MYNTWSWLCLLYTSHIYLDLSYTEVEHLLYRKVLVNNKFGYIGNGLNKMCIRDRCRCYAEQTDEPETPATPIVTIPAVLYKVYEYDIMTEPGKEYMFERTTLN